MRHPRTSWERPSSRLRHSSAPCLPDFTFDIFSALAVTDQIFDTKNEKLCRDSRSIFESHRSNPAVSIRRIASDNRPQLMPGTANAGGVSCHRPLDDQAIAALTPAIAMVEVLRQTTATKTAGGRIIPFRTHAVNGVIVPHPNTVSIKFDSLPGNSGQTRHEKVKIN